MGICSRIEAANQELDFAELLFKIIDSKISLLNILKLFLLFKNII